MSLRCCHCPICGFVPSGWDRLCGANFDFWATFLCGLFWDVGYFRTWPMLGYLGPPVGYSGTACVGYLLCGLLGTACVGVPCVGCVRVSMGRGSP